MLARSFPEGLAPRTPLTFGLAEVKRLSKLKLPAPPEKDCVSMPMVRKSAPSFTVWRPSSREAVALALHE